MSDGKVVFDTRLNNKQLEKDYDKAVKKLEKLEADLNAKKDSRSAVSAKLAETTKKADEAREHVKMLKDEMAAIGDAMKPGSDPDDFVEANARKPEIEAALKEAEKALLPLEKEADKVAREFYNAEKAVDSAERKMWEQKEVAAQIYGEIEKGNEAFQEQEMRVEEVAEGIGKAAAAEKKMSKETNNTSKRLESLGKRFAQLAASALVFSVATKGLTMMRDWLGEVVTQNDQTAAAIARLKGALLTLAQPLLQVVIPVFTALVNLLTAVIGKIAAFLSMLGGKTVQQSADAAKALNAQADAYGGVADAAKKAQKQLMGFDEINKLESTETPGAAGGGGASGEIAPDFSWADGVSETMEKIAFWVLAIAAGLALWKIGSMFTGTLGKILTAVGTLAVGFGLVGLGIALLVDGFKDAAENGLDLENMLKIIGGIIAAGLGITVLTGSLIPLLVAGIMSILLALAYLTGNGDAMIQGFKDMFGGLLDFISGVFAGDWEKAWGGIFRAWKGWMNIGVSIVNTLLDLIVSALNLIQIDIPDWVPFIGGGHWGFNLTAPQLPYLAEGAVIPPNRQFLAVLGDQTHGTNIEAPLDTIKQAVAEVLAGQGGGEIAELLRELIATVQGIEIGDDVIGKAAARYTRKTARARGT